MATESRNHLRPSEAQRRRGWWLLIFGGWTLYGLFFTVQSYAGAAYFGRPVSWWRTLAVWLICAYVWMLFTPGVIALAKRFPLERGTILRRLPLHLFAGALISALHLVLYTIAEQLLLGDEHSLWTSYKSIFVGAYHANLLLYWSIVGLTQAYDYYRRYRERERRAAQLELAASQMETELARAQLGALRAQLHPHFLFNTLNTISVLMHEDATAAERMLVRLSELLRLALKNADTHEVPLRKEMEFLRSYLEIEQTRFQDRLRVLIDVDPQALEAQVPNLILQPLVENAIRHGIAPRAEAGLIEVRAARRNGTVELRVSDDGSGFTEVACASASNGIGLSNTRARLEKLYGAAQSLSLARAASGGLEVSITIPFRTATEPPGRADT